MEELKSFDWDLISAIHKTAFNHLYKFAGELRQVNMSKGGFTFPTAKFLSTIIQEFEAEFLTEISTKIENYEDLVEVLAPIHAELLFIHPFREGNGRTARLLADLMALKFGFDTFHFENITDAKMPEYIKAVQSATEKNYKPMIELFRKLEK